MTTAIIDASTGQLREHVPREVVLDLPETRTATGRVSCHRTEQGAKLIGAAGSERRVGAAGNAGDFAECPGGHGIVALLEDEERHLEEGKPPGGSNYLALGLLAGVADEYGGLDADGARFGQRVGQYPLDLRKAAPTDDTGHSPEQIRRRGGPRRRVEFLESAVVDQLHGQITGTRVGGVVRRSPKEFRVEVHRHVPRGLSTGRGVESEQNAIRFRARSCRGIAGGDVGKETRDGIAGSRSLGQRFAPSTEALMMRMLGVSGNTSQRFLGSRRVRLEQAEVMRWLEELKVEHRDLDEVIRYLIETGHNDHMKVQRLKKRKLRLKDSIAKLESQLIPDLDA